MSTRKPILTTALLALMCAAGFAQTAPASPRTVSVTGTAVIQVKPDFATVQVGAFSKSSSAVQAKRACDAAMAKAVAAIKKLGVKSEDIATNGYNIFPTRVKDDSPIIWKVQESAEVKVRNLANVATVIDTAVTSGAPNVGNIQFGLDEVGTHRSKVREQAVKVAIEKAKALALLFGTELGEVQSINEQGDFGWRAQYNSNVPMAGDAGGLQDSISAGQQSVSLTVNVVFAIK